MIAKLSLLMFCIENGQTLKKDVLYNNTYCEISLFTLSLFNKLLLGP